MIVWVVIRRFLALFIRGLLWKPLVTLGAFVILFGIFVGVPIVNGLMADRRRPRANRAAMAPVVCSVGGQAAPAPAVEAYVKGMATFDASLMWSAMSAASVSQMEGNGGSVAKLQQGLDEMRKAGASYEDIAYIGGYPLADGGAYFFYVVSRRGFAAPNSLDQVYFVFTVGPDRPDRGDRVDRPAIDRSDRRRAAFARPARGANRRAAGVARIASSRRTFPPGRRFGSSPGYGTHRRG